MKRIINIQETTNKQPFIYLPKKLNGKKGGQVYLKGTDKEDIFIIKIMKE